MNNCQNETKLVDPTTPNPLSPIGAMSGVYHPKSRIVVTATGLAFAVGLLLIGTPVSAQVGIGEYGPAFTETGFHSAADYFAAGSQVVVNHFGGTVLVTNTDVNLPSIGGLSLAFTRSYSTNAREKDGPLGLGWSGHFGFLRTRDISTGGRPEFVNGSGGREIFYPHDRRELEVINPTLRSGRGLPAVHTWISQSLRVLEFENQTYTMFTPGGLTYVIKRSEPGSPWVPTRITDKSENFWTIHYRSNWWADYPDHPVVEHLAEGTSSTRRLEFEYVTYGNKPRLDRIVFGSPRVTLASYRYRTLPSDVLLREHKTAADRTTTFTYYESKILAPLGSICAGGVHAELYGALESLTLDTGGKTSLKYKRRCMFYPDGDIEVLAVDTLTNDGVWTYSYPRTSLAGIFDVDVTGPKGYSASYDYHGYSQASGCWEADAWMVGLPFRVDVTIAGETTTTTTEYEALQISDDFLLSGCPGHPSSVRTTETTTTQDGHSLTTSYKDFDLIFPETTESPGDVETQRKYCHFVGGFVTGCQGAGPYYVLGIPRLSKTFDGTDLVGHTEVTNFWRAQPWVIRLYRTASASLTVDLDFYPAAPKAGAVHTKTVGSYTETYDYQNGVLRTIDYPGTRPSMTRTITSLGRIRSETVDGVERTYGYDDDGRMTSLDNPSDVDASIVYTKNLATVTRGPVVTIDTFDAWGRLERVSTRIGSQTVESSYGYDKLGRKVSETTPFGLTYTIGYDVHGRLKTRTSSLESFVYQYETSSAGVLERIRKNQTWVTEQLVDHLGRFAEGDVNGNSIEFDYTPASGGIKQTITVAGQARSVTTDFLGNVVEEVHPEFRGNSITNIIDQNGWIDETLGPEGNIDFSYWDDGRIRSISRIGYSPGTVEYEYSSRYGGVTRVSFGDVVKEFPEANFDSEGRPRLLRLTAPLPQRLEAPATSLTTAP